MQVYLSNTWILIDVFYITSTILYKMFLVVPKKINTGNIVNFWISYKNRFLICWRVVPWGAHFYTISWTLFKSDKKYFNMNNDLWSDKIFKSFQFSAKLRTTNKIRFPICYKVVRRGAHVYTILRTTWFFAKWKNRLKNQQFFRHFLSFCTITS